MPDKSPHPSREIPGHRESEARLDGAIRSRVDEVVDRRLADLDRRLTDIEKRLKRQRRELDQASRDASTRLSQIQRLVPQLAALEVRVSEQQRSSVLVTGTPSEMEEARSVVDEVRREHDRVRARLSGVAWYEDRLRKLEEQLETLTSGVPEEGPDD